MQQKMLRRFTQAGVAACLAHYFSNINYKTYVITLLP